MDSWREFELKHLLGRGGMGDVRLAVHRRSGQSVAIKLLSGGLVFRRRAREAFADEVRVVAALAHPNIIWLYDHGEVPLDDPVAPDSPYLVMALADGGTLQDRQEPWPWIARVTTDVLTAMGHAHARGVIHRDLKPANILLHGPEERVIVSDFGIAHRLEQLARDEGGSPGTPAYMAPEQVQRRSRDLGPWTDLYAIGGIVWYLVTGASVFAHTTGGDLRDAQLRTAPPRLAPRTPVPAGLDDWLRTLLAKNPSDRFASAAAALSAMEALGPMRVPTPRPAPRSGGPVVTQFHGGATQATELYASPHTEAATTPVPRRTLAVPAGWQQAEYVPPRPLLGVGLSLFGLRHVPLVGRQRERDRLWAALQAVCTHRRPRLVLLRGPAGQGKSRLLEWIGHRAQEVGSAFALRATHQPIVHASDGVGAMVCRHWACVGLERARVVERIHGLFPELPADDVEDFAEVVAPNQRFTSAVHRHTATRRALAVDGQPRVIGLEDVHWGADSLAFVERCLNQTDLPLLFVATVQDEALANEATQALLKRCSAHEQAETLDLEPSAAPMQDELLQRMVGLDPSLRRRICERTSGNPLFALQLIADWVQQGILVGAEQGFQLHDSEPPLPKSVAESWRAHFDRVVSPRDPHRASVEIAAMLGFEVDPAEWQAVCERLGVWATADVAHRLQEHHLWRRMPDSGKFTWAHGMLRETVQAGCPNVSALHADCARALTQVAPDQVVRIAQHWLATGDPAEGMWALAEAAASEFRRGNLRWVIELGTRAKGVVSADRDLDLHFARSVANAQLGAGDQHGSQATLEAALSVPGGSPVSRLHTRVGIIAAVSQAEGPTTVHAGLMEVLAEARALGTKEVEARILRNLGECLRTIGRHAESIQCLEQMLELEPLSIQAWGTLAPTLGQAGRSDEAVRAALRTLELATENNVRNWISIAEATLGDLYRKRGEYDLAVVHCRRAIAHLDAMGSVQLGMGLLNLSLVHLARGEFQAADEVLQRTLPLVRRTGPRAYVGCVLVTFALLDAHLERWHVLEAHLAEAVHEFQFTGYVDQDVPTLAVRAGDLAISAGRPSTAKRAFHLAADQYERLGDEEQAIQLRGRVA